MSFSQEGAGGEHPMGEDSGADMGRPLSQFVNRFLRRSRNVSPDTVMDLGSEHGEVPVDDIRGVRRHAKEGYLYVYIRQMEEGDPRAVLPTVVAIGAVAAGIHKLRHRHREK
ncbi:MAG: hypothetical protein Q7R60_03360 [bacterium]|nr:hypothetical protein [bacterium]